MLQSPPALDLNHMPAWHAGARPVAVQIALAVRDRVKKMMAEQARNRRIPPPPRGRAERLSNQDAAEPGNLKFFRAIALS